MPLKPSGSEPGLNSSDPPNAAIGEAIKRIIITRSFIVLMAMVNPPNRDYAAGFVRLSERLYQVAVTPDPPKVVHDQGKAQHRSKEAMKGIEAQEPGLGDLRSAQEDLLQFMAE